MKRRDVLETLLTGLNPYERKLHSRLAKPLVDAFLERLDSIGLDGRSEAPGAIARQLTAFLKLRSAALLESALDLRRRYAAYAQRFSRALTPEDKERHILDFARELGATARELRGDAKAFARWFGHDAITERYERRLGSIEREVAFVLERTGVLAGTLLASEHEIDTAAAWERLELGRTLKPFFAYDGDSRVSVAAFRCLARALKALPAEIQERSVDEGTLQFIYRSAMHTRLEVWLQCEALGLLESLSPSSLCRVLERRLANPASGDDIFVRRRAVEILARSLERMPALAESLPAVARDPSPFVRQGLAAVLPVLPADLAAAWLPYLALEDPAPQVRGAALAASLELAGRADLQESVLETLAAALVGDQDPFVLRVAAHVAAEGASLLAEASSPFLEAWQERAFAALERLHVKARSIPARRWAAQAMERIWCASTPAARGLKAVLEPVIEALEEGERRRIPRSVSLPADEEVTGRVLSVLSQDSFGLELERTPLGPAIRRGHAFGFRLWRFLHEVRSPSPDKRQGFRHTIGRIFRGRLRAPSAILAELAETRVPGEPLAIAEEGGWRPYLPLLDEVLSSLRRVRSRPVKVFTSEGVTEIVPPRTLSGRLRAWRVLTTRFAAHAKLRNWRSQLQESPAAYLRALEALGFRFRFRPHPGRGAPGPDPAVTRFFPVGLPLGAGELWGRLKEYFVSVYDNSLLDLALFIGVATGLFVARHVHATASVRRWRRRIPLVVGGWGTRGKSGTERLKAALFNALGHGVVSKTTGCEAMFLNAPAFGKTREMFLFRSYDKATIWEQRNVLKLAHGLEADVFLWECMALTPSYVEILQHHWVRDDISTITNAYPDHEDIQGPAGVDIPDTIGIFLPPRSKAVTTEEVMLPILEEIARKGRTELRRVSWLEAGILAPDVLARFPYEEHPSNVALVLGLADELGIRRDFALKEMADRVVPDLGVLKTSPVARVKTRRLQFSNGCSANERHGTLSNWVRCGFDAQDPVREPGVWITTVVNNRADRVPRSRVFARVLVEDIQADRHFLIGGNLTGLLGYIKASWDAYAPTISLWPKDAPDDPCAVLREMARRFRLPFEREHVLARLAAMVRGQGLPEDLEASVAGAAMDSAALRERLAVAGVKENLDEILRHHEENLQALREHQDLLRWAQDAPRELRGRLDEELRAHLWSWFQRKLVVIHDYHATGEQIVKAIAGETPPGYLNRIMGIQNIKGTGLDFVYRWQAWAACHRACEDLKTLDAAAAERGLRALASFREYGVLSEEHVQETLEAVKRSPAAQSEAFQAELAVISSTFEAAMRELREKLKAARRKSSFVERLAALVESFLDAGDAVRRRKTANQIYEDLIAARISHDRAALELQELNVRQKGGWLLERLASAHRALARGFSAFVLRRAKG
ncbi:MAG: hypothetical protein HY721_21240 [Planctomycetes bacterium]|nr:hypothetical protein [Planctomycetota bacterium]